MSCGKNESHLQKIQEINQAVYGSLRLIGILFEHLHLQSVNRGWRRDLTMIIFASQRGKKCQDVSLPRHTLSFSISLSAAAALTQCLERSSAAAAQRQQVTERQTRVEF